MLRIASPVVRVARSSAGTRGLNSTVAVTVLSPSKGSCPTVGSSAQTARPIAYAPNFCCNCLRIIFFVGSLFYIPKPGSSTTSP